MWYPIQVQAIKQQNNKTILQIAVDGCHDSIIRHTAEKGIHGELRLDDNRRITAEQRKKLYATFADIADYIGDIPEYIKEYIKFLYRSEYDIEHFSLSNCSVDTARDLINFTIDWVLMNNIPLKELALDRTDDIGAYLYSCIKHKRCVICGKDALVYTLDRDRNKMALCLEHREKAKGKGLKEFCKLYKVYGIKV